MDELVTIGFIANKDSKNTVYALNTILGQSYSNIELVVSVDKTTGISICDIIDCINSNRKENIRHIDIHYTKDYKGMDYHVKYIHEKSSGEYITFVQNTQGYYDANAIAGMMKIVRGNSEYKVWKGQTIMFNTAGEYIGNALPQSVEDLSVLFYKMDFKKEAAFHTQLNGCYKEEEIITVDVPFLRYVKEKAEDSLKEEFLNTLRQTNKKILNAAHFTKLDQMLKNLNKYMPSELYQELQAELKYLQYKEENTYWKLTDSDFTYGKLLLEIQKQVNPKKKKLSIIDYMIVSRMLRQKISKMRREKIHLVFFAQEYSVWSSMQSVYEAAQKDERYEADLVYVPFEHFHANAGNELEIYRKQGYLAVSCQEYDLRKQSPDIAFFLKPYDYVPQGFYVNEIVHVIDKSVYLGYGISSEVKDIEFIRLNYLLPMFTTAWQIICNGPKDYENFRQYSYVHAKNCLKTGSPRLDVLGNIRQESYYAKCIRALAGNRKIILWNTHHTIGENGVLGTFFEYSRQLIAYMKAHQELFLIWRPHPLFYKALEDGMSQEEIQDLWREVDCMENMVLDTEKDYLEGFFLSDAMISDYSTLVKEYILLRKPLLITKRAKYPNVIDGELLEVMESAVSFETVEGFLDRFLNDAVDNTKSEDYIRREYYLPKEGKSIAGQLLDEIASAMER